MAHLLGKQHYVTRIRSLSCMSRELRYVLESY